jgi:hypothetical protein
MAAIDTYRTAGDVDGLLDALELLVIVDLQSAHWGDVAATAQVGMEVSAANGRDTERSEFGRWLANTMLWGNTNAADGIETIEALLRDEKRRSSRASMLSSISTLRALLGDQQGWGAADAESAAIYSELGEVPSKFRRAFARYALDDLPGALAMAREEAADLERRGDTGQRSTMVALEAWILALKREPEAAVRAAEQARELGAPDDATTQIMWRSAAGIAESQLGHPDTADLLTTEAVALAAETDSMDDADAWEARAHVLRALGRRPEMLEAASRARELHAAKGAVNLIRRVDQLLADSEAKTPVS